LRELDTVFGAVRSGRRVLGHCAVEWFFAALKNEMSHRQSCAIRVRARFAVAEYIEIFTIAIDCIPRSAPDPFESLTDYRAMATAAGGDQPG